MESSRSASRSPRAQRVAPVLHSWRVSSTGSTTRTANRAERKLGGWVESAHRGTQKNYRDYSLDLDPRPSRIGIARTTHHRIWRDLNSASWRFTSGLGTIIPKQTCMGMVRIDPEKIEVGQCYLADGNLRRVLRIMAWQGLIRGQRLTV